MFNSNPIHRTPATPEALFQLELLLQERAVDLAMVTDIVTRDPGLRIHVLHLAHDMGDMTEVTPSLHECIVEIGIEGLRESLREARMRRRSN
jgi:hypothetical protein